MENIDSAEYLCGDVNYYGVGSISSWDDLYLNEAGQFFMHHIPTGYNAYDSEEYTSLISREEALIFCKRCMHPFDFELLQQICKEK